jgi:hypothetical protein
LAGAAVAGAVFAVLGLVTAGFALAAPAGGVLACVAAAGDAAAWGVRRPTGSFGSLPYPINATFAATVAASATARIKPTRTNLSLELIMT